MRSIINYMADAERRGHRCVRPILYLMSVMLCSALVIGQAPIEDVDAHVAVARAAAGLDFRNTFINLCLPAPARGAGGAARGAAAPGRGAGQIPDRSSWYAPPFKVFDNFYWLGTRQHSSWALQTSGGIVILDTNFAWATEPEIIEGVIKLGLNPRDIKYVVISHAHGDHDQGAAELQKRFGAKVVMGFADWASTLQRPATAAGGVPTKDIPVDAAGYKLTLGASIAVNLSRSRRIDRLTSQLRHGRREEKRRETRGDHRRSLRVHTPNLTSNATFDSNRQRSHWKSKIR